MKTGIDTNVLVRWLTVSDDEAQFEQAAKIMAAEELHLSAVATAETIWVLSRVYRISREQLSETVHSLLNLGNLTIDRADALQDALAEFDRHGGDFNDHLIAAHDQVAGCAHTLTFDKKAARSKRFKLI